MAQTALIQVRVEDTLKQDADALFADLGFDTPTAIRMFLKQAIKKQGLPFEIVRSVPNAQTIAAMEEAEQICRDPDAKRYSSFSQLLQEVQNEI